MEIEKINYDYLLKYIIVGDSAVGKSNLLLRFIHDDFKIEYQSTIGVEFDAKNLNIKNKIFRLQIWDSAGQETYRSITRTYYKNCVCAILVYDISNRESFENISQWVNHCIENSPKKVFMILVGNKCDLIESRQIPFEKGKEMAEKNNMMFFETSAKTGENVEKIFVDSTKEINNKIIEGYYDLENDTCGIKKGNNHKKINNNKNNKKNRLC